MARNVHLAQVNIGRIRAPLDSPLLAAFVARLDEVNALADRSPGFVWRLQTPEGNATDLRPYDDDRILVNMSVWESLEHLEAFVFASRHVELLRQRRDWFEKFEGVYAALWWVAPGHQPSIEEAKERLAHLAEKGRRPTRSPSGTRSRPPPRSHRTPVPLVSQRADAIGRRPHDPEGSVLPRRRSRHTCRSRTSPGTRRVATP